MMHPAYSTTHSRQVMLNLIDEINRVDSVLRPITLWLNYNGCETSSCCAGHPISDSYKGESYDVFGYICFNKTPKLVKMLKFLVKNGFEIENNNFEIGGNESGVPVAKFVFIRVEKGKLVRHYKGGNTPEIFQQEIDTFWDYLFEEMRHLKI